MGHGWHRRHGQHRFRLWILWCRNQGHCPTSGRRQQGPNPTTPNRVPQRRVRCRDFGVSGQTTPRSLDRWHATHATERRHGPRTGKQAGEYRAEQCAREDFQQQRWRWRAGTAPGHPGSPPGHEAQCPSHRAHATELQPTTPIAPAATTTAAAAAAHYARHVQLQRRSRLHGWNATRPGGHAPAATTGQAGSRRPRKQSSPTGTVRHPAPTRCLLLGQWERQRQLEPGRLQHDRQCLGTDTDRRCSSRHAECHSLRPAPLHVPARRRPASILCPGRPPATGHRIQLRVRSAPTIRVRPGRIRLPTGHEPKPGLRRLALRRPRPPGQLAPLGIRRLPKQERWRRWIPRPKRPRQQPIPKPIQSPTARRIRWTTLRNGIPRTRPGRHVGSLCRHAAAAATTTTPAAATTTPTTRRHPLWISGRRPQQGAKGRPQQQQQQQHEQQFLPAAAIPGWRSPQQPGRTTALWTPGGTTRNRIRSLDRWLAQPKWKRWLERKCRTIRRLARKLGSVSFVGSL
mmetsp:Transcript_4053/g.9112  ORF Transcript_4053/g.9112 Transcript_4053/m.9112 type:complete len:514 (+) Transcript_4053:476-2017(+)